MTTELTKIKGIGEDSADDLRKAGFDSIEAIAKSTPEELSKIKGFGAARANRVIKAAKELTKDVKPAVTTPAPKATKSSKKADSIVYITAKDSKSDKRRWSGAFISVAAVIVLFLVAAIFFFRLDGVGTLGSFVSNKQEVAQTTPAQGAANMQAQQRAAHMQAQQQAWNAHAARNANAAQNANTDQAAMNGMDNFGRDNMAPGSRQQAEPEWVASRRAEADKMREESWNRYLASMPPAQAEQVARQHAISMQRMEEAKKRHMAMVEQRNAYMNQRYGNRRFGG